MALVGTEIVYVVPLQTNGQAAAVQQQTTTGAIAALASSTGVGETTATTISTAGAGTLTAAALIGGIVNRTGPVAAFTDTTDTAVAIVAAIGAPFVTQSFYVNIKNTTAFAQTLAAGAGVTLPASIVIPANSNGLYLLTLTSLTAVTLFHVATTPLTDFGPIIVTPLTTVGAGTILAAGIAGGATTRSGAQSATPFTDTTDTAALIIAAQPNARIGQSWEYVYKNNTDANATLVGGTGVTVSGFTVIPPNGSVTYLVSYTAAATITMAGLDSGGFATDSTDATKVIGLKASGMTTGKTATIAAVNANDATYTLPAATDTLMGLAAAQTITGAKTFTNSDLILLGSSTGANTFTALNASATNYTTSVPATTGVMQSTTGANLALTDIYRTTAPVTANATVTPATVTGLSGAIAVGTYRFRAVLPSTVASGTGGIAYNFLLTTAVLSAIQYGSTMKTASALQYTQGTTAASGTVVATQAAVVLETIIEGTMTVSTAGTFAIQMAQAVSNASNSVALLGGSLELTRIA